jgi:hypothetical protein
MKPKLLIQLTGSRQMKCTCNTKPKAPLKARFKANGFEHIISFSPGFLCEKWLNDKNDKTSHGQGSVGLGFYVGNEKGFVQFTLLTGWYYGWQDDDIFKAPRVMPSDLGYHSPVPRYDGQTSMGTCFLLGKECYYDGSSLNAEDPFNILIQKGEDALWLFLETFHNQIFTQETV